MIMKAYSLEAIRNHEAPVPPSSTPRGCKITSESLSSLGEQGEID